MSEGIMETQEKSTESFAARGNENQMIPRKKVISGSRVETIIEQTEEIEQVVHNRASESNLSVQDGTGIDATSNSAAQSIEPEVDCDHNKEPRLSHSSSLSVNIADKPKRNSIVSFSDECQFHEINPEEGKRDQQFIRKKPPPFKSVRYYVMMLALMSPFVVTYSRTIINFAITDMIHPDVENRHNRKNNVSEEYSFERDNSCPITSDALRERLIKEMSESVERAKSPGEKFKWDGFQQGLLKSAYAIGHAPLQIPSGRFSEIYGAHLVMSISSMLIAACCMLAPYLAAIDFYLLFADLVVLGSLGSFMTPALITLISNWLTPGEKSIMMSFYLIASRLGSALSSILLGLLIDAQLSWRYAFFIAGWTACAFSTLFFILARGKPTDHYLVSELEIDYLASKNALVKESLIKKKKTELRAQEYELKDPNQKPSRTKVAKKNSAPWLAIVTNVPVWAFITTKFCVKLAGDTVQIELPRFLKSTMHFSAKDNGSTNAISYVIFCISCFAIGALGKYVIKKKPFGMSKTAVRKSFQCLSSFGVSLILFLLAHSICDGPMTKALIYIQFVVTTFSTGGEAQIPLDIGGRYSGTIHAIASSLAISSAIEPITVGYFIKGREADRDVWKLVWMGASAVSIFGGLVFLLFGDASPQKFGLVEFEEEEKSNEEKEIEKKDKNAPNGLDLKIKDESLGGGSNEVTVAEAKPPFKESKQI